MFTSMLQNWGARLRDPKNQGNVMLGAGGVLVADGLIGLENPFAGRNRRPGIFGALFMMIFGLIFVLVGVFMMRTTGPIPGGVTTTGHIVDVSSSQGSHGTTYAPVIEFTDQEGHTHTFTDSTSSSSHPSIGSSVKVSYDPNNPSRAHNLSNPASKLLWIFVAVGAFVMLAGFWIFVLRAISIVGGLMLLRWGWERRRQAERGEEPTAGPRVGSALDKLGTWMQARAEKRAGGDSTAWLTGGGMGVPGVGAMGIPAMAAAAAAPQHVQPGPGWYVDPNDANHKRWWDGSQWGTQVQ